MPKLSDDYFKFTGEELPIGEGMGQSIDDPIVIYADTSAQATRIEYKILRFWSEMRQERYSLIKQTLLGQEGRSIDKLKIAWESDQLNYYSFYFDVTSAIGQESS